jgi:hypothetical protein
MRVESNRPLKPAATRRGDRARDAGGTSFAEALTEGELAAPATSAAPAAGISSLLALQEVEDPASRRRRAAQRGDRLLDRLDEIRRGLLAGSLPQGTLAQLRQELREARAATLDPRLDEVLAEIELRAAVELAKLEAL